MSTDAKGVQHYFERVPEAFDQIYESRPRSVWAALERWRHRSMFERFRLTLEACGEVKGTRMLDLGCGSGRYSIALARRGADVVGIDFSQPMVELAARAAAAAGVAAHCRFIQGDLLRVTPQEPFDTTLAIGLFDYVRDPVPILEKIRQVTTRCVIASFPVRMHVLTPLRKLRLSLAGCPVYFYTKPRVEALLQHVPGTVTIQALGRDYMAVVTLNSRPGGM